MVEFSYHGILGSVFLPCTMVPNLKPETTGLPCLPFWVFDMFGIPAFGTPDGNKVTVMDA